MPLVTPTYAALKAALDAHLFHTRLAGRYDEAVHLFETAANRRLRVRQMEGGAIMTAIDGAAELPADYLVWRSVLWNRSPNPRPELPPDRPPEGEGGRPPEGWPPALVLASAVERNALCELDYVHPAYLTLAQHGEPMLFTIQNNTLFIRPVNDLLDALWLLYYQKIPTILGADSNTNWLLTDHPDVYVSGVLAELHVLGRNMEQAQLQKARRDEVLAEIIQLSALTTGATSPSVRTAVFLSVKWPRSMTATATRLGDIVLSDNADRAAGRRRERECHVPHATTVPATARRAARRLSAARPATGASW